MKYSVKKIKKKIKENIDFEKKEYKNLVTRKIFLFFSHKLTYEQEKELRERWNCEEFMYLPENLQELWSNVDENVSIATFLDFLKERGQEGDLVLIQGEWGLTFRMILNAISLKMIPIYSYAKRRSEEVVENGYIVKKSYFKHEYFVEYGEGQYG